MEWVATARLEVVNVAELLATVPVPRVVEPSKNVTVPVGDPAPGAVTLMWAVKVTLCPLIEGFCELLSVVEVDALFTT